MGAIFWIILVIFVIYSVCVIIIGCSRKHKDKYTKDLAIETQYKLNKHCNLQFNSYDDISFFCKENDIDKERIEQKQIIVKNWEHDFRGETNIEEKKIVFYIRYEWTKKEDK